MKLSNNLKPHRNRNAGVVLLEIIFAVALFSLVATSMAVALDRLASASLAARKEARILRRMETVMTQVVHQPGKVWEPRAFTIPADGTGVRVDVDVIHEPLQSVEGITLDRLFRVRIRGRIEGEHQNERTLERLVFSPIKQIETDSDVP